MCSYVMRALMYRVLLFLEAHNRAKMGISLNFRYRTLFQPATDLKLETKSTPWVGPEEAHEISRPKNAIYACFFYTFVLFCLF